MKFFLLDALMMILSHARATSCYVALHCDHLKKCTGFSKAAITLKTVAVESGSVIEVKSVEVTAEDLGQRLH